MTGWTPLFQQIIGSSVWSAADHVRLAWITILAVADKTGVSPVTAGGLSALARITREQAEDALLVLSSPDQDTLTQKFEGRRLERVSGGWKILNWEDYRTKAKAAVLREYNREAQASSRMNRRRLATEDPNELNPPVVVASSENNGVQTESSIRLNNIPASVDEVILQGATMNPPVTAERCREFWAYFEGQSRTNQSGNIFWVTSKGVVVTNWKAKLGAFTGGGFANSKKGAETYTQKQKVVVPPWNSMEGKE